MNDVLLSVYVLAILLLIGISIIFTTICCVKLTEFRGSDDDGKLYVFTKEKLHQIKNARLIGKLILLPILFYVFICETIAIIIAFCYLLLKSVFLYIFNKNEKLSNTITRSYGYNKYLKIDGDTKFIVYTFLGYHWIKPYINTDIEW